MVLRNKYSLYHGARQKSTYPGHISTFYLRMCLGEEATAATEAETDYEVFLIFRRRMRTAEEEKKSPRPQQMFKWETAILYV